MPTKNPVVIGLAAAVTMILAGCGATSAPDEPPPATVESIAGSPVLQIQLTEIEEYARLGGHADFLRERIDGRVGQ